MAKVILILDGVKEGKVLFDEIIRNNNYYVLHIDATFYYTSEFDEITEEWFVRDFTNNPNVNVLIIYNCKPSVSLFLQNKYENCFNILISDNDKENNNYCKVLNYLNDEFYENVLKVLRILTKDIGE
jgi:hypothetical protein